MGRGFESSRNRQTIGENTMTSKAIFVPIKEKDELSEVEVVEEQLEFDFDYDTYGGGSENFGTVKNNC